MRLRNLERYTKLSAANLCTSWYAQVRQAEASVPIGPSGFSLCVQRFFGLRHVGTMFVPGKPNYFLRPKAPNFLLNLDTRPRSSAF